MITKNKSYHEILINGHSIGFAISIYYYNSWSNNSISTELIPYPTTLYKIPTLKFNSVWPSYKESQIISVSQDESEIKSLLNEMFSNLNDHIVEIIKHREGYNLHLKIGEKIYNGFLVHERRLTPNFKQVQLFPSNEILRYNIDKNDSEIEAEIVNILMNK